MSNITAQDDESDKGNTMEMQEALATLQSLGRAQEVTPVLNAAVTTATQAYEPIAADSTTSDSYKTQLLAVAYDKHATSLAQQIVTMATNAVQTDRADAEQVFGTRGIQGDGGSLAVARRDAQDRTASIDKPAELLALVKRATRSGDETLARAAAERATELGDSDTVNEFLLSRPTLDTAAERLWNTRQATSQGTRASIINAGLLAGLKPGPLQRKFDSEIRALAYPEQ